eukprot:7204642-Pyramimonas_sp.AAC.1
MEDSPTTEYPSRVRRPMAAAFAARWGQLAGDKTLWAATDEEHYNFYAPLDHCAEPEALGHDCHRDWGARSR